MRPDLLIVLCALCALGGYLAGWYAERRRWKKLVDRVRRRVERSRHKED